jgi:hypothetical protein
VLVACLAVDPEEHPGEDGGGQQHGSTLEDLLGGFNQRGAHQPQAHGDGQAGRCRD